MKKFMIASFSFFMLLIAAGTIVIKQSNESIVYKRQLTIARCGPNIKSISYDLNFIPLNASGSQVISRKNAHTFTGTDKTIKSFRLALEIMKSLETNGSNDLRSWKNITSLHGTHSSSTNDPEFWNSAYPAHRTQFFLAWHRVYLYFFERIVMKLSNDPNFRLPYWNSYTKKKLPNYMTSPVYNKNNTGNVVNPLYISNRQRIELTIAQHKAYKKLVDNIFSTNYTFCQFEEQLEVGPHEFIHGAIGGANSLLGNLKISPKDPVFFLLHANIDRLWEKWYNNGNKYPSDSPFLNEDFYFINEDGMKVKLKGSQIMNTAADLGYKYTSLSANSAIQDNSKRHCCVPAPSQRMVVAQVPQQHQVSNSNSSLSFQSALVQNFSVLMQVFTNSNSGLKIYIEFENLKANSLPSGPVGIYLKKNIGSNPTPSLNSFVGLLDIFNGGFSHNISQSGNMARLDATKLFKKLIRNINDLKNAGLSFAIIGNTAAVSADIQFSGINIVVDE